MAIIYGRSVGLAQSGGGIIPPRPDESNYSWYRTITNTTNIVVTDSGWYRIYVVGNGGNGSNGSKGDCPYYESNSDRDVYYGSGGGGGGTGGYSVHEVYCPKETVLQITNDSAKVQLQIGEDIIYATHGGNGGTATSLYYNTTGKGGAGGAAGTAAGGNILNYNGNAGNTGGSATSLYANTPGGAGAVGTYNGSTLKYKQPLSASGGENVTGCSWGRKGTSASGTSSGNNTLLGGAGGGGSGGAGQLSTTNYSDKNQPGGAGGSGYTGGVVLEIVAD